VFVRALWSLWKLHNDLCFQGEDGGRSGEITFYNRQDVDKMEGIARAGHPIADGRVHCSTGTDRETIFKDRMEQLSPQEPQV